MYGLPTEQKTNTDANANEKGSKDRRNAKRGLETEKEDNGETTKVKRHKKYEKSILKRKWKITKRN